MITIDITMPGRVWEDFLDPDASDMQAELELPPPERTRHGKGVRYTYRNVPAATALDLARYLYDRGDTLLGQGVDDPYDPMEKASRDALRGGIKVAETIRADEQKARVLAASPGGTLDTSRLSMRTASQEVVRKTLRQRAARDAG